MALTLTVKQLQADNAANIFELLTREWYARHISDKSESHKERVARLFEKDIFPYLGSKPITDIKPVDLLNTVRRIEARNAIETAHRALQLCGQVFRYAVATGRIDRDITPDLRGSLSQVKAGIIG